MGGPGANLWLQGSPPGFLRSVAPGLSRKASRLYVAHSTAGQSRSLYFRSSAINHFQLGLNLRRRFCCYGCLLACLALSGPANQSANPSIHPSIPPSPPLQHSPTTTSRQRDNRESIVARLLPLARASSTDPQTPLRSSPSPSLQSPVMASFIRPTLLRQSGLASHALFRSAAPTTSTAARVAAFHASSRRSLLPPGPRMPCPLPGYSSNCQLLTTTRRGHQGNWYVTPSHSFSFLRIHLPSTMTLRAGLAPSNNDIGFNAGDQLQCFPKHWSALANSLFYPKKTTSRNREIYVRHIISRRRR